LQLLPAVSSKTWGDGVVLVVPWLLEREYRRHRQLDPTLPATHVQWLATVDSLFQREAIETLRRVSKVVIHPGEIEIWARHEGRPANEQARSDYAHLLWRSLDRRFRAGRSKVDADTAWRTSHGNC
jgi:hypothetical protein